MSHYRKVDTRIWNDAKFRRLTNTGKLLFLFLVTHPGLTALGAMRGTAVGLCEELAAGEDLRPDWAELLASGMVECDPEARFVALPNFLRYNRPESPNVIRSWVKGFDLLPECSLRDRTLDRAAHCASSCGEGFLKAFREAFQQAFREVLPKVSGHLSPNQEQEQEQEHVGGEPPTTPSAVEPAPGGSEEGAGIPPAPAPQEARQEAPQPTAAPTPAPSPSPTPAPAPEAPARPAKPATGVRIEMADRALVLPDWLQPFADQFAAFEEVRWKKNAKAPYTARAQKGILEKLDKLRQEGQDLGVVLMASVNAGWTDVYAQKSVAGRAQVRSFAEQTQALAAERVGSFAPGVAARSAITIDLEASDVLAINCR